MFADPAIAPAVRLLPGRHFFLRVIPVEPGAGAAGQVGLFLERVVPFPASQLAGGFLLAPSGRQALVFAAHRPRLERESPGGWAGAATVLPDVLALVLAAEAAGAEREHDFNGRRWVAAWDQATGWLGDLSVAPGNGAGTGEAAASLRGDGVELLLTGANGVPIHVGRLTGVRLHQADVRGAAEAAVTWRARRQGRWLARATGAALLALTVLGVTELAVRLVRLRVPAATETLLAEVSAWQEVAAHAEFAARGGLGPLDAVALVNQTRPADVRFHRVAVQQGNLICEGTAPDEAAGQAFATTVRAAPGVKRAELVGSGTRFTLTVQLAGGGEGAP